MFRIPSNISDFRVSPSPSRHSAVQLYVTPDFLFYDTAVDISPGEGKVTLLTFHKEVASLRARSPSLANLHRARDPPTQGRMGSALARPVLWTKTSDQSMRTTSATFTGCCAYHEIVFSRTVLYWRPFHSGVFRNKDGAGLRPFHSKRCSHFQQTTWEQKLLLKLNKDNKSGSLSTVF